MIQICFNLLPGIWSPPMRTRSAVVACMIFVSGSLCLELRAQSFLDKLEKAVRNQLSETPPSTQAQQGSSGELPPPKAATNSGSSPAASAAPRIELAPSSNVPVVPQPGDARSSILENAGPNVPPSGGQIYLGLEAEEPIGAGIGVRVSAVTNGSPAWKAGFKNGDRILAVNGFAIGKINDMAVQLGKTKPGDAVRFLVSRAGRNFPLTAVLMDAGLADRIAGQASSGSASQTPDYVAGPPFVGLTVNDLTSSFRNQFGISVFRGAAVSGVAKGSPAYAAGIRAGDAVIELGGFAIESAKQLQDRVSQLKPGEKVELLFYRGSIARLVEIVVGNIPGTGPRLSRPSTAMRQAKPALIPEPPRPGLADSNGAPPLGGSTGPTPPESNSLNSILDLGSASKSSPPKASAPTPSSDGSADRDLVRKLEAENGELLRQNDSLRKELVKVNEELKTTQAKLDQILDLLKKR